MSAVENEYLVDLDDFRAVEGLEDADDFEAWCARVDDSCPALCTEGCEVEPDGECEHGCPSVLVEAGVI